MKKTLFLVITLGVLLAPLTSCQARPDFSVKGRYAGTIHNPTITLTAAEIESGQKALIERIVSSYIEEVFGVSSKWLTKRIGGEYVWGRSYVEWDSDRLPDLRLDDESLYHVEVHLTNEEHEFGGGRYKLRALCFLCPDRVLVSDMQLLEEVLMIEKDPVTGKYGKSWWEDEYVDGWRVGMPVPLER